MFTAESISRIKASMECLSLTQICSYARIAFPNEACGFSFKDGNIQPAHNVIAARGDYALTSRNAFAIDINSWETASRYVSPIVGVWHSHTNGDPSFSQMDKATLRWANLYYVVVALIDSNPTTAKLFWWTDDTLNELPLQI